MNTTFYECSADIVIQKIILTSNDLNEKFEKNSRSTCCTLKLFKYFRMLFTFDLRNLNLSCYTCFRANNCRIYFTT